MMGFKINSDSSCSLPLENVEDGTDKGLLVNGGRVHQEPGETEAPR